MRNSYSKSWKIYLVLEVFAKSDEGTKLDVFKIYVDIANINLELFLIYISEKFQSDLFPSLSIKNESWSGEYKPENV